MFTKRLTKRVNAIKPSPTLAISAKAKELNAKGINVVNFGAGEPDFDTPDNVKEAAYKAIKSGFTKYTDVSGIADLKTAIIDKYKKEYGLEYAPNEVIVNVGAKHTLYNIAMALYEAGDEVIIPSPYWVSYPDQVILADAIPVIVKGDRANGFKVTPAMLDKVITAKTKAIILNSPNNPTGFAYSKDELQNLADYLAEKDLWVITDEIYEKLTYDGFVQTSIVSLNPKLKDKSIIVNGVSKTYSMTGWRIGYALGPKEVIAGMKKIQGQSTSNPDSIAQKAAVEAMVGDQSYVEMMRKEFDKRRIHIVELLNAIPGVKCAKPQGAFYAFPDVSGLFGRTIGGKVVKNATELADVLLETARVAVVPGFGFGDDDFIRLSYATSMEKIEEGIKRIKAAVAV